MILLLSVKCADIQALYHELFCWAMACGIVGRKLKAGLDRQCDSYCPGRETEAGTATFAGLRNRKFKMKEFLQNACIFSDL
ncbi:MAG: hypothetical protein IJ313_13120 [Clostridia bacterium]|nr:hypothetical protein [Clostridia bacterium]